MKRTTGLLALLATIFSTQLYAQDSRWSLWIESGPTVSNLGGKHEFLEYDLKAGHSIGIGVRYKMDSTFSICLSVGTERKGGQLNGVGLRDEATGDVNPGPLLHNFDYLAIPVLFRGSFGLQKRFYIQTGPFLAILTRSEFRAKGSSRPINTDKFYRSSDIGISAGVGHSFVLASALKLNLELRYNLGLTNVLQDSPEGVSYKHRSMAALIGLVYEIR